MEIWTASDDIIHRGGRFTPVALAELASSRLQGVTAAAFKDYAPITVHLDGKISVRKRATPYKGAMFAAHPGDIVFSKIDARSGAIGVVGTDIGPAVVTPEFPVFTPNLSRLNATFMRHILRTGELLNALSRKASGTSGRKRVTPTDFLSIAIPLPLIDEQRALVAAYDAALRESAALEAAAATAEADALAAFEATLGLAAPTPLPNVPRFIARFSAMDRWSHEAVLRRLTGDSSGSGTYPMVLLRDVLADIRVGVSPNCQPRPREGDGWAVLKLSAVTGAKFRPEENKAIKLESDRNAALEVREGDVLIARGSGITKFVGAACIVDRPVSGLMLCDLIFRVEFLTESPIDSSFLANVLAIPTVRRQIESTRTGAAPGIQKTTKQALLSLTFPLPTDVAEQRSLIAALEKARAGAATLCRQAAAKRDDAWSSFEAAIYGE